MLFALVDAKYKFRFIDVGVNGRANDSTIYAESNLYKGLINNTLNIPSKRKLKGQSFEFPYFFIGDDAFALNTNLMKPYNRCVNLSTPQVVFNYRISRARMVVECAFGQLATRFRIFRRPLDVLPETVDLIVMTACALHNFIITENDRSNETIDDNLLEVLPETLSNMGTQIINSNKYGFKIRDNLATYLISDGDVNFQWKKVSLTPKT